MRSIVDPSEARLPPTPGISCAHKGEGPASSPWPLSAAIGCLAEAARTATNRPRGLALVESSALHPEQVVRGRQSAAEVPPGRLPASGCGAMLGCAPTIQSRLCSEAPAPHHRITFLEEDVTMLSDRCEHCAKQLVAVHATYLRNSEYSATAPQISATPTPTHPSVRATCFGVMASSITIATPSIAARDSSRPNALVSQRAIDRALGRSAPSRSINAVRLSDRAARLRQTSAAQRACTANPRATLTTTKPEVMPRMTIRTGRALGRR